MISYDKDLTKIILNHYDVLQVNSITINKDFYIPNYTPNSLVDIYVNNKRYVNYDLDPRLGFIKLDRVFSKDDKIIICQYTLHDEFINKAVYKSHTIFINSYFIDYENKVNVPGYMPNDTIDLYYEDGTRVKKYEFDGNTGVLIIDEPVPEDTNLICIITRGYAKSSNEYVQNAEFVYNGVVVIDNLTTTASRLALSCGQGKVLKDYIDELEKQVFILKTEINKIKKYTNIM